MAALEALSYAAIDAEGRLVASQEAAAIWPSASLIKVPLAWQWLLSGDAAEALVRIEARHIWDDEGSLAGLVGAELSKREIARRMIVESENNATNLVLDWVGGFAAANAWMEARGWREVRWGRRMADWAARAAGAENTATALGIATILGALRQDLGSEARVLLEWLAAAVGDGKLEPAIPPGARLAHKVGDLPDGIEHDAGIVELADGRWLAIALLSRGRGEVVGIRAAVAAAARALIAAWERGD